MSSIRLLGPPHYFRNVAGLPEESVPSSLAFSSGIHAALGHHYRELLAGDSAPDQDTLLAVFWDGWHRQREPATIQFGRGEDVNTIGHLADRVLATFRQSELARPAGPILGIDEALRGAIVPGVPDLVAHIDLLVETDEALIVTDFKTSRSRWSEGQADDQSEPLLLYGELARGLVPGKTLRLEFAVISKTKRPLAERHAVPCDAQRRGRSQRMVERIWQAIQGEYFYPAPRRWPAPVAPFGRPANPGQPDGCRARRQSAPRRLVSPTRLPPPPTRKPGAAAGGPRRAFS